MSEPSGACSGSQFCDYGFERAALCIDGAWLHCGGVTQCLTSESQIGGACCGSGGPLTNCGLACPSGSGRMRCECTGNHWRCDDSACNLDGGSTD